MPAVMPAVVVTAEVEPERAIWCGSAAVVHGIPSIDVRSGEAGLVEDRRIEPIVDGVLSVMRHLQMIGGEPSPTTSPLIIRERAYVESQHEGIWFPEPRIEAGSFVPKGTRLGTVTDFFGKVLMEARAPESGMLLLILSTPPVNAGETLAVIANVQPNGW